MEPVAPIFSNPNPLIDWHHPSHNISNLSPLRERGRERERVRKRERGKLQEISFTASTRGVICHSVECSKSKLRKYFKKLKGRKEGPFGKWNHSNHFVRTHSVRFDNLFDVWHSDVFASLCVSKIEKSKFLKKVFFFSSRIEFPVSIELISNFCFVLSQRPQFNNPVVPIVVSQLALLIKSFPQTFFPF